MWVGRAAADAYDTCLKGKYRFLRREGIDVYNFGRRLKTFHPIRVHLQTMDFRTGALRHRFNPANAGIKHLAISEVRCGVD